MANDDRISNLPYRPCVGLMLLNAEGMIFAGRRVDNPEDAWQMPQGGIDKGEEPETAALRELGEETGLSPEHVALLRAHPQWLPYDLPRDLAAKLWKGRYRGQSQKWFALRLTAPDSAINIHTAHPEFRDWKWMSPEELLEKIVIFKRPIYEQVLAEFADLTA